MVQCHKTHANYSQYKLNLNEKNKTKNLGTLKSTMTLSPQYI